MLRISFLFLAILVFTSPLLRAQSDSTSSGQEPNENHLRISLITCGPGDEEIWEVFGHTAIRIVDSSSHVDLIYNYGTFEFGPNFEMQFMRGKLLYCLSVDEFYDFVPEYITAKRSIQEQVLQLTPNQKRELYTYLNENAEPANKYYKYDFFFDNCATRVRDLFPKALGPGFVFGRAIPQGERITFRDIINRYFFRDHWTRVGVNLLLGSKIDRPMTNEDIMFLPDYLRDGLAGSTLNGQKIAAPTNTLLAGSPQAKAGVNLPFLLFCLAAVLTIAGLTVNSLQRLGKFMSALLLMITGVLGIIILLMWFGTDHQGCRDNFNILWCLPTNIILAVAKPKGRKRYAAIAMFLLLMSLALHIFRVQGLTLPELSPIFLSLLFIYGNIYKSNPVTPAKNA